MREPPRDYAAVRSAAGWPPAAGGAEHERRHQPAVGAGPLDGHPNGPARNRGRGRSVRCSRATRSERERRRPSTIPPNPCSAS